MLQNVVYLDNGYLGMGEMFPHLLPFTWMWGGRGIGKTYGTLLDIRLVHPRKFIYMRRTQKQADMVYLPLTFPFKRIDADHKIHTTVVREKDLGVFYDAEFDEAGELQPRGDPLGYALALATIHNIRGVDLSDVDILIYDEFIDEPHARPIRDEYGALLNAYETINRNRELEGRPPLQFLGLTNSNSLGNPYFLGMGVIRTVDSMIKRKREIWADAQRGIMLINVLESPISEQKRNTALYRMAGDGAFVDMSLGNEYSADYCSNPGYIPLRECRPLCVVGELCIYEHKHSRNYYVTDHVSGSPKKRYGGDGVSLLSFRRDWFGLWGAYLDRGIVFQDILCEILWKKYWG